MKSVRGLTNIDYEAVLNYSTLPSNVIVQANFDSSMQIGSIEFIINGSFNITNTSPYKSAQVSKMPGKLKIMQLPVLMPEQLGILALKGFAIELDPRFRQVNEKDCSNNRQLGIPTKTSMKRTGHKTYAAYSRYLDINKERHCLNKCVSVASE